MKLTRATLRWAGIAAQLLVLCCMSCQVRAWPKDPVPVIDYRANQEALALQAEIKPATPITLLGSKLTPNYLTGFLSLGTGQELIDAQAKLVKAWNSSESISKLIREDATQAPVNLPAKFKTPGPLNSLLGELVVLYYATWQGVESARREYYRMVEREQLANITKLGVRGITPDPPFGRQYVQPLTLGAGGQETRPFFNKWFAEDNANAGNGVTAYAGTYLDVSKGPLIMTFPKITDYFLISFYNFYGEVIATLGTRVKTTTAKKILLVSATAPKSPIEAQFAPGDIIRVPGVDASALSRILGPQRSKEYTITPAAAAAPAATANEKAAVGGSTYWWGVDPAVYYIYNTLDPLYYWKIAGLVLARNPRQGLTAKQRQLLKDLHFTSNGLEVSKLSRDQKQALIATIPIAAQGLAQSFYLIGPKEQGYWYTTTHPGDCC